jgi:RimJ/RimL family protein N-acetyltransferase
MDFELNHLNQPVGLLVPNWHPPKFPSHETINGQFCRLEPLEPKVHAESLFEANKLDVMGLNWTYLPYGPFDDFNSYQVWMLKACTGIDPQFYAIIDLMSCKAVGIASYLRIDPNNGSIEVGHLNYSPLLQRTPAATESMYLLMKRAFNLGYRRYEWKCNALNAPSRIAAQRLGFSYEGLFLQATIVKGRNRDTAWYSITDKVWPEIDKAFSEWLSPSNFDEKGSQKTSLSTLTESFVKIRG